MEKTKLVWALLLIGACFWVTPSTAQVSVDCSTQSLQTAISGNDPGTTFNVTGTCNENITIGETRERVTINGGGTAAITGLSASSTVITIRGQGVTVTGFTISGGQDGILVTRGGTATIDDNIIQNTGRSGVAVNSNAFATIINNTISDNPVNGINVSENSGARIGFSLLTDTVASPNIIQNSVTSGIEVIRSSRAWIVGNTISSNDAAGIVVSVGSQAAIASNTINDNLGNGVYVGHDSYVSLGALTGSTIFQSPNITTVNNGSYGLRCEMGTTVTGRIGTLNGAAGAISNTGIGIKTSELANDYGIDILTASSGLIQLGNGIANNTGKVARMVVRHYNNAEEPVYLFGSASIATDNFVAFGGGSPLGNAATQLDFYTGATNTTQTGTSRITIKSSGFVGFGTQNPANPLQMASTAHVTSGGVWTNASSREYKDNIKGLKAEDAIETLQGLNPVSFNYKISPEENHVGFIAEDVPELVATKDRKGLSPMDIVAVLTKVVQEQQQTISTLSGKVSELEKALK